MSHDLNPGQLRLVQDPTRELFVSAGAGTGKTHSLARRFVEASPQVDRVLTITFTDKAAGELLERIRLALVEQGRAADVSLLDSAWVSTIHGFCRRVLKRYALEAGIDPFFAVLDEVEARSLAEECFESVTRAAIERDPDTERTILAYGSSLIRQALFDVYGSIRHHGRKVDELWALPAPDPECVRSEALGLLEGADRLLEGLDDTATIDIARAAFATAGATLHGSVASAAALSAAAGELEALRARGGDALRQAVATGREARDLMAGAAAAHAAAPHADAFVALVREFDSAYAGVKRERGVLDFEDLQALTLELFEERPGVATRYREHFAGVMVDEFQDTDALQLRVIEQVSDANLCTVGDEFQSIYGFRCADVEVYRRRAAHAGQEEGRARLELNYRSDPAVLAVLNEVFSSDVFFGGDFERLEPGTETAPACRGGGHAHVTVLLTDHRAKVHSCSKRQGEAAALAAHIERVLADGYAPSDVVLLLRALTPADVYVDSLASRGIAAHVEGGGSFFEQEVVQEARCLLRALANPLDDEALGVLLSGAASSLTEDALYRLSAGRRHDVSLWHRLGDLERVDLAEPDRAEATRLHKGIESLRTDGARLPVSRLLRAALRVTGLDVAVAGAGTGLGDLDKLVRIAEEFQRGEPGDLGGLLDHLDLCERHARREPRAMEAAPENAVRIMSVHRAKGLEFPVVVVADLGRSAHAEHALALVDVGEEALSLALVAPAEGERAGSGVRTPALERMLEERRRRAAEEGDRILYVACTRAERMLVLSGATDMGREPAGSCDADRFRLALGVGVMEPGERSLEIAESSARVLVVDADTAVELGSTGVASPEPPAASQSSSDTSAPTPVEPEMVAFPAKAAGYDPPRSISFTDLEAYRTCPYRWYLTRHLRLPERPIAGAGTDPRLLGTAVHAALQVAGGDELQAIAKHERLDAEGVRRLEVAVSRFREGPLAARLKASGNVSRELPFAVPLAGTVLVGSIDAIAQDGDRALIVDYKTGAPDASTQDGLGASRLLQAACYAHAAAARGASRIEVVFSHVEHEGEDARTIFDERGLSRAIDERVLPLAAGILAGEVAPTLRGDAAPCRRCPGAGGLCPGRTD